MYRVYFTEPREVDEFPESVDYMNLITALQAVQNLRNSGMKFVTLVSELEGCTSPPGAKTMKSSEYLWTKCR